MSGLLGACYASRPLDQDLLPCLTVTYVTCTCLFTDTYMYIPTCTISSTPKQEDNQFTAVPSTIARTLPSELQTTFIYWGAIAAN
jgi:hypothetical protein